MVYRGFALEIMLVHILENVICLTCIVYVLILVMLDQTAKKILSNSIKKPVHKDLSLCVESSSWI